MNATISTSTRETEYQIKYPIEADIETPPTQPIKSLGPTLTPQETLTPKWKEKGEVILP